MNGTSPAEFLKEASNILNEEYPLRLEWVQREVNLAVEGAMRNTAQRTANALNEAMWAWNDVTEQFTTFLEAAANEMDEAALQLDAQSAVWEAYEDDADVSIQGMALAMRRILLSHEGSLMDFIELHRNIVTMGVAFGVAGLAKTIETHRRPRLELILSRLPEAAKDIGASAVLGPVKDAIELGFKVLEADRSEEERRDKAASWHGDHQELVSMLELWTAQLRFIKLVLVRSTESIKNLIPSKT